MKKTYAKIKCVSGKDMATNTLQIEDTFDRSINDVFEAIGRAGNTQPFVSFSGVPIDVLPFGEPEPLNYVLEISCESKM